MAIKSTYHKTEKMGAFSGEKFYTTNQDLKRLDTVYVISSKGKGPSLIPYLEGSFRVEKTTKGSFRIGGDIYEFESILSAIVRPGQPIDLSSIRKRMSSRAFASRFMNVAKPNLEKEEVNEFDLLLAKTSRNVSVALKQDDHLFEDVQGLIQSDTETLQLVLARIGQGKFRNNVTDVWGAEREMCALTGISVPAMLTASHIIPWRECTDENARLRLDGANGILLCAHIDRLFDKYLLSFKQKGTSVHIQYSKTMTEDVLSQLSLTDDLELVPNRMSASNKERFFANIAQHFSKYTKLEAER